MTLREFIIKRVQIFFFLVTMILIAQIILGNAITPKQVLHYSDLTSTLIMAGLCMLPSVVTYSKKELSFKRLLIRQAIQLVLIEGIMLTMASIGIDDNSEKPLSLFLIGTATLVIYVLAIFVMWYQQYLQSKKLTEQLKMLQKS